MATASRLARLRELVRFADDLAALGATRASAARLWLAAIALPLKARLPGVASLPWRVSVRVDARVHELALADRSDFQVLAEVLVDRVYDVGLEEPRLVVDLGAHVGISVLFFHTVLPGAEILAVEPDPANFRLLERNVSQLPRVTLRRAAVSSDAGAGAVVRTGQSWTSHVAPGAGADVDIVRLDDLVAGADASSCLLKIDVEGDEWDVLSAADLGPFSTIVGELHPAALPVDVDEFFALLVDFEVTRPADPAGHGTFVAVRRTG
jgi:FkbM family methyltransferase